MSAEPTPMKRRKPSADRGLPHNWETERAVLGALLTAPERLPDIRLHLEAEDFHRPAHKAIFGLLVAIAGTGGSPGLVALLDEIERRNCAESVGGIAYVAALMQAHASIDLLDSDARRVRDYAVRRELVLHARQVEADVLDGVKPTPDVLDAAASGLAKISATVDSGEAPELGATLDEVLADIEWRADNPGALTGVPTGFHDLDRKTTGLHGGDVTVLAARPAMGKTALVLNIAVHAAKQGYPVGVFSMEMSRKQLLHRVLCAEARVDAQRVRNGEITTTDRVALRVAVDQTRVLPIDIDDAPGLSLLQLRSRVRAMDRRVRLKTGHGLRLLIFDYLQLMSGTGAKGENRENAVSAISRGLKILAKEMDVPVLVLSQLNRSLEARADKRPMMSDLRESGAIEQDADNILFIYRDEVYHKEQSPKKGIAEIILAKQRQGPIGSIELAFIDRYVLFQNLAQQSLGEGYY